MMDTLFSCLNSSSTSPRKKYSATGSPRLKRRVGTQFSTILSKWRKSPQDTTTDHEELMIQPKRPAPTVGSPHKARRSDATSSTCSSNFSSPSPFKILRQRLTKGRRTRSVVEENGPNKQWTDSKSVLDWARQTAGDDEDSGVPCSDNDGSSTQGSGDETFAERLIGRPPLRSKNKSPVEPSGFLTTPRQKPTAYPTNSMPRNYRSSTSSPQIIADHVITMHTPAPPVVGRRYQMHRSIPEDEVDPGVTKPPVVRRQGNRSRLSSCVDSCFWDDNPLTGVLPPEITPTTSSSSVVTVPARSNGTMTLSRAGVFSPNRHSRHRSPRKIGNPAEQSSPHSSSTQHNVSTSSQEDEVFEKENQQVFCTLPRHKKEVSFQIRHVTLEKGPGHKSLGFTIVGGVDSNKGCMGIFIKRILPVGQAIDSGALEEEDEILSINGKPMHGLSHAEAIRCFKEIKNGKVALHIGRRRKRRKVPSPIEVPSKPPAELPPTSQ